MKGVRRAIWVLVVVVTTVGAGAEETAGPRQQGAWDQNLARAQRSSTTGARGPEGANSYDLSLDGDVRLGGGVYKDGNRFIHHTASSTGVGLEALEELSFGFFNTALGLGALRSTTVGGGNTAVGDYAMLDNENGFRNTAVGQYALQFNVSGTENTAVGYGALRRNFGSYFGEYNTGSNTAVGVLAMASSTSGIRNTALGRAALSGNFTGSYNLALGYSAGANVVAGVGNILINSRGFSSDSRVLRIGSGEPGSFEHHLDAAYIHGIFGSSVSSSTDVPVLIDDDGKLGTIASSRRYKDDIRDMAERSEPLYELRPVTFRYKHDAEGDAGREPPLRYGLVAEEVAEVFPELVVYDEAGRPETVKYHLLSAMLLNELQRLRRRMDVVERRDGNESGTVRSAP